MPHLPPLTRFETTIHTLHQVAQIPAALRLLALQRLPNYLELGLAITQDGLGSEWLPGLGEVRVNFRDGSLDCTARSGARTSIPIEGATMASLLAQALDALGAESTARDSSVPPSVPAMLTRLEGLGHPFSPPPESLTSEERLRLAPSQGAKYADALYRIFTAAARFRGRLAGSMTPIVVWPEHFDLSFLWFATDAADDAHPHMNFGFAPFSDDIDRPYLYAYGYPMPAEFERTPPPRDAGWHMEGWQGVIFPYDTLAHEQEPEARAEEFFAETYRMLSPSLRLAADAARA